MGEKLSLFPFPPNLPGDKRVAPVRVPLNAMTPEKLRAILLVKVEIK